MKDKDVGLILSIVIIGFMLSAYIIQTSAGVTYLSSKSSSYKFSKVAVDRILRICIVNISDGTPITTSIQILRIVGHDANSFKILYLENGYTDSNGCYQTTLTYNSGEFIEIAINIHGVVDDIYWASVGFKVPEMNREDAGKMV